MAGLTGLTSGGTVLDRWIGWSEGWWVVRTPPAGVQQLHMSVADPPNPVATPPLLLAGPRTTDEVLGWSEKGPPAVRARFGPSAPSQRWGWTLF